MKQKLTVIIIVLLSIFVVKEAKARAQEILSAAKRESKAIRLVEMQHIIRIAIIITVVGIIVFILHLLPFPVAPVLLTLQ